MVEMDMFNVQRAITPKVGKPELRFMCSASRLIVLYICAKFGEIISDGISYEADTNDGSADGRTDGRSHIYWVFSLLKNTQQYVKSTY